MSWRVSLQVLIRLGLVLSVALSTVTFGADDAEARRGKVRTVKERATNHDDASSRRKSDDNHGAQSSDGSGGTYVPRVRSREATHGSAETATDSSGLPTPRRLPRPHAQSTRPFQDIEVPGCPEGMICTVCLAGCHQDDVGAIVDAQPKMPRPEPLR
ncbi:MAG: hypothetical protein BGN89_03130 [Alphaproteobacteria bacterium 64-6]|nr:MAG: hypothetical protein BGN89_03130 [Alphaproteobacteria bacterium 64-6]